LIRASVMCATVILAIGGQAVWAGSVRVPVDYATISEALASAGAGDTVFVDPGQYPENLSISRSVHLIAEGDSTAEIVAQERATPAVHVESVREPCTVRGFKINGMYFASAGIQAEESFVDILSNEIKATTVGVFFRRSQGRIEDNLFRVNPGGALRLHGSSPLVVRNRFEDVAPMAIQIVGKDSAPVIGGRDGSGNVFGAGYSTLVSNETKNDIDARYNEWNWSATVEMKSQGYPSNITAIYDQLDDAGLGTVDFRNWVEGESAGGPGGRMMWLIPVAVVVVLVWVLASRRARGARA